jgi:hypothetical protein
VAKKPVDDRRRKLDELKRKQHSSERRGTIIAIAVALLVGGLLIGGAVVTSTNDPSAAKEDLDAIGVPAAEAGCGEVKAEDEKKVSAAHVPGQVEYPNPPSSGNHNGQTAPGNIRFYPRDTDRAPEQIVHNLEHGYLVAWYDDDLTQEEVDQLQAVSRSITDDNRKFIAVPWTRGKFEGNANVALATWARMQLCEKISGEAIGAFSKDYGFKGDKNVAPEKNAP